jgi:uncharacterized membrane protein
VLRKPRIDYPCLFIAKNYNYICRILIDEEDDEDLKRAIELSLLDQEPNSKSNTNTSLETKKRKHDGNHIALLIVVLFSLIWLFGKMLIIWMQQSPRSKRTNRAVLRKTGQNLNYFSGYIVFEEFIRRATSKHWRSNN